jgi:hypothetical protein
MMHNRRRWCVSPVASPEDLAEKLTQRTWTLCTGFSVATHPWYLFLNDAAHEAGAGVYAVVSGGLDGPHLQIEGITFSWCSYAVALDHIRKILAGECDTGIFTHPLDLAGKLDVPPRHGRCRFCA